MTATLRETLNVKRETPVTSSESFEAAFADVMAMAQPAWLRALRERAWATFNETGIPSSRDEEWRFTPVKAIGATSFEMQRVSSAIISAELPKGVTLMSLSKAIEAGVPEVEQHLARYASPDITPFAALNMALATEGVVLVIEDGVRIEDTIRIVHHTGTAGAHYAPRVLIVAWKQSQATVVEHFGDSNGAEYFTNACCEVVLGEGARIEHLRLQDESSAAWHIGLTQVEQARDSHYRSFSLALGGKLARHNLHARLSAPNIETLMYGLYLTVGDQLIDSHTAIYHDQPHCNSWEVYKGILNDRARAVFNGKVFVKPEAQKTDAKQTNRNLLLSDEAKVDTKPQLEIFADDVKCTHGATIGKPDPQQRYYLQTRGIGGKAAQSLLLWAFCAEVLAEISSPVLREEIEMDVRARLNLMVG